ncbi:MAG: hypothetical protein GKC10_04855 [Methanosarcinales archaeon]|nr:hypothetical protein [Methanosarcinales archaeon]
MRKEARTFFKDRRDRPATWWGLVAITALLLGSAQAALITVGPEESIQAAINAAGEGDWIEVQSGTYQENLEVYKPVVLRGNLSTGTGPVIDAKGRHSAVTIYADGVTVEGFVITGSGASADDAGLKITSRDNLVRNNLVGSNANHGILISQAGNNTIRECSVQDNAQQGIMIYQSSDNRLSGNAVMRNLHGIGLFGSTENIIQRNTLSENRADGLYLEKSDKNNITGNQVTNNSIGLSVLSSRGNTIASNNITDNREGMHFVNRNDSESITQKAITERGGVSIKYRPAEGTETKSVNDYEENPFSSNTIYQNYLDNQENVYDDGSNNWYSSALKRGNSYSQFDEPEEGCRDRNRDGVCDSSYNIAGGSLKDLYPLVSREAVLGQYRVKNPDGTQLGMDRNAYLPRSDVLIRFKVPANFTGWMGIFSGARDHVQARTDEALTYRPLPASQSGSLDLKAPSQLGSYDLRLFDQAGLELAYLDFQVMVPSLAAAPLSVSTCEQIAVTYSGAPGMDGDWIGLFRTDSSSPAYRQYLDGNNGSFAFSAPTSGGTYELRMFDGDGNGPLATAGPVEIKPLSGVKIIASPSEASAGQRITVSYWGALPASTIGMYMLTSPDKNMLAMKSTGGNSCGTLTFAIPGPGRYDFRLFENNVYRKHMGASNVVVAG